MSFCYSCLVCLSLVSLFPSIVKTNLPTVLPDSRSLWARDTSHSWYVVTLGTLSDPSLTQSISCIIPSSSKGFKSNMKLRLNALTLLLAVVI